MKNLFKSVAAICLLTGSLRAQKIVASSLADPHTIRLTRWQPKVSLELGPIPQYLSVK